MFICPHCNHNLPDDALFCENCGNRVSKFGVAQPTAQEAVKPRKKGKSLKIFVAGMLAVIVVAVAFVLPNVKLSANSDETQTNAQTGPAANQPDGSTGTSSPQSTGQPNANNATGGAEGRKITSLVGTWTDPDGQTMTFKEDGSLLCGQPGNGGAYAIYVGGLYEFVGGKLTFTLGPRHIEAHWEVFKTYESNTGSLDGSELRIPLASDDVAVLTLTSDSETGYAPLSSVIGTVVTSDDGKNKFEINPDGTWTSSTLSKTNNAQYWRCVVGKKGGENYGAGVVQFMLNANEVAGTYQLSAQ